MKSSGKDKKEKKGKDKKKGKDTKEKGTKKTKKPSKKDIQPAPQPTPAPQPASGGMGITVTAEKFMVGLTDDPQENFLAFKKKYKVTKTELGKGAFSVVRLGMNRETKEEVAIKIIDKKNVSENFKKNLGREIQILTRVDHPNIVCLRDLYDAGEKFLFVMELVTGGELFDRIVEKGFYTEDDAKQLVKKIVSGVAYLHSNGIAHRDLKPENLLLKTKDNDYEVKIADFGLSSFIDSQKMMQTACGTPAYVAPEVLKSSGGYDKEVDLWSVGVITYILLCGFPPFHAESVRGLLQVVIKGQYDFPSPYWDPISSDAKDFISQLLTTPERRMNAEQTLQHPWLKTEGSKIQLPSFRERMQTYITNRRKESMEMMDKHH